MIFSLINLHQPQLETSQYVEISLLTLQQVTALYVGFDVTKFAEPAYQRFQRGVFTENIDPILGTTTVPIPATVINTLDHYYLVLTSDLPFAALTGGVQISISLNIENENQNNKYKFLNAVEPALFKFQLGSTLLHLGILIGVMWLYYGYFDKHTKQYIRSYFLFS